MTRRLRLAVALLSFGFLFAHVVALPRTLEDQDSINFALAVERFDVSGHRPHPPGYPVYVALAKASTAALRTFAPSADRDRTAAQGLAVWGVIAGTIAPFVLVEFWLAVGLAPVLAVMASALAIASPLFWFTASRPMTDVPGLVAALAVQTLCIRGWRRFRGQTAGSPCPREWVWAAGAAGLIVGLRSQTLWLTAPLLAWSVGELIVHRRIRQALRLVAATVIGVLVWAVPMIWLTGGLDAYVAAVRSQGHDDLRDVQLLSTNPTFRMFKTVLARTFMWPWSGEPQRPGSPLPLWLGYLVALLALIGAARLIAGQRRMLAAVLLSFGFYIVFHFAFHETLTLRYALPIVVPMAGLAVVAMSALGTRAAGVGSAALVAVALFVAQPALQAYARDGDPFFRGFQQMLQALPREPEPPMLRLHHQVWWPASRVLDWFRPVWNMGPQPHPGDREWGALVREWGKGDTRSAWYLTDVTRTDIALFDPRSRTHEGRFAWEPQGRALLPGARRDRYDWWEIRLPVWMLGPGWGLTPEISGMTAADTGSAYRPAQAFLRQGEPLRVLIGGRHLNQPPGSVGRVSVSFGGRELAQWFVRPDPNWFVQFIDVPMSSPGSESYGALTVTVSGIDGSPRPNVGLEQFDAAPLDQPIAAFVDGWQEPEGDQTTGRLWRWTSARSTLEIRGGSGDLALTISGESPLKYFDAAPDVVVKTGATELARFQPVADFTQIITIPAAALAAANGRVAIETSRTFVPAERGENQDRRQLGLRLTDVRIRNK